MYYHLTTNHLLQSLLFRDVEDRLVFLNRLAILSMVSNVAIFAYCLMDNHVHLLVSGAEEDIRRFFLALKKEYAQYADFKYGDDFTLKDFLPDIKPVDSREFFRAVVAYILRNPLKAGISCPYSYPWSSSWIYFQSPSWQQKEKSIKEYGMSKYKKVFHTRKCLQEDLKMCGDVISPRHWCAYVKVEGIFGTSIDLFKAVSKWNMENDVESLLVNKEINSYTDAYLTEKITSFCNQFGVSLPSELDTVSFRKLISRLSRQYGSPRAQIKRLTGADDETIIRFS